MLNDTARVVNQTISSNNPVAPGFIFATLQAYNATGNATFNGTSNNDDGTSTSTNTTSSGGSKETGLAM
jgi:hypothetical protein